VKEFDFLDTTRTAKGPEPERLKIEDWIQAVDHTLKVKRPATGWAK
jgi:hypothetical protein